MEIQSRAKIGHNIVIEIFKDADVPHDAEGHPILGPDISPFVVLSHNMNVNAGLNFARNAISRPVTAMSYIACGSDNTAAGAAQTALIAEIERVPIFGYDDTATGAVRFRAIFEANQGNGNLIEFGLLNAAAAGTMMARSVLGAAFTKDSSIILRVNWTVTFADT